MIGLIVKTSAVDLVTEPSRTTRQEKEHKTIPGAVERAAWRGRPLHRPGGHPAAPPPT